MIDFTKGPYRVFVDDQDCVLIYGHDEHDGNFTICRMEPWGSQLRGETMATARLFSQAPDLYEALETASKMLSRAMTKEDKDVCLFVVNEALRKARGE